MNTLLSLVILLFALNAGRPLAVSREVHLMGTTCSLTVFSEDRAASLDRLERFIRVLENTERELSTWREGSILTALNRQPIGEPLKAEPSLCRLFSELQRWNRETRGTFDPAIGAYIEAWGLRTGGRFPRDSELMAASGRSGMRLFAVQPSDCTIAKTADVTIDCGAFAKGEALDRLRASDSGNEFSWLVDLGGQIAVNGRPPGTGGWDINIAHPRLRDKPVLNIRLASGSLATSGGSERNLQVDGKKVSHILDPRSGLPVDFDGSVSVWHESALTADILSTALYVMGPDDGYSWAESRGIAACYLFDTRGGIQTRATRSFNERFLRK